ncbi:MAG TPA: PfkB family carbohydrate kinase [Pilimelia sp.]|nr:PfkB family carbohydrate kinase [Pilimelia sp.]
MRRALVLGEALVDLLDTPDPAAPEPAGPQRPGPDRPGPDRPGPDRPDPEPAGSEPPGVALGRRVFRPAPGGAPLNVAVGVARLGGAVDLVGAVGADALGDRLVAFLATAGVGTSALRRVATPTALAVTTFTGAEPEFRFYGEPPSYAEFGPADVDLDAVAGAAAVSCGSIALLRPGPLAAARRAWAVPGPWRVFDPNVRPALLTGPAPAHGAASAPAAAPGPAAADVRALTEEFAATADLVKLSAADAALLYPGLAADAVLDRLRAAGARAVLLTRGARAALLAVGDDRLRAAAPSTRVVDTTGAGDAVQAAVIVRVLAQGPPAGLAAWRDCLVFALRVAALVCESPGGAASMPTRSAVAARFDPTAAAGPGPADPPAGW